MNIILILIAISILVYNTMYYNHGDKMYYVLFFTSFAVAVLSIII